MVAPPVELNIAFHSPGGTTVKWLYDCRSPTWSLTLTLKRGPNPNRSPNPNHNCNSNPKS